MHKNKQLKQCQIYKIPSLARIKQNKNEIEQARKELKRALDEIEELLEGEEF